MGFEVDAVLLSLAYANMFLHSDGIAGYDSLNITNDGMDTMIADKNSAFAFKLSGIQLLHSEYFMMGVA